MLFTALLISLYLLLVGALYAVAARLGFQERGFLLTSTLTLGFLAPVVLLGIVAAALVYIGFSSVAWTLERFLGKQDTVN